MAQHNCQSTSQYSWEADKVEALIRLHAEHSHFFTGNQNSSRYAWAVIERKLKMPMPILINKWNNILQEYQIIKTFDAAKRLEWPFFNLMDAYLSDERVYPKPHTFSSTQTMVANHDDHNVHDPIRSSIITAASAGCTVDTSNMITMQGDQSRSDVPGNSNTHNTNVNRHQNYNDKCESSNTKPQQHNLTYMSPHTNDHKNDQYLLKGDLEPLYKDFYDFQKTGKMVDATLAAGGKLFKVHKLVLSICSPYFEMIFLEDPSPHPTIIMPNVESSHMAGLIEFMYTGKVYVDHDDLPKFMKTAESLKIKGFHIESSSEMDESNVSPTKRKESKQNCLNPNDVNIPELVSNVSTSNLTTCDNSINEDRPLNYAIQQTNKYTRTFDDQTQIPTMTLDQLEHGMQNNGNKRFRLAKSNN